MKPTQDGSIPVGDEQEPTPLKVQLSIVTDKEKQFIDGLEELCKKCAVDCNYYFKFN